MRNGSKGPVMTHQKKVKSEQPVIREVSGLYHNLHPLQVESKLRGMGVKLMEEEAEHTTKVYIKGENLGTRAWGMIDFLVKYGFMLNPGVRYIRNTQTR